MILKKNMMLMLWVLVFGVGRYEVVSTKKKQKDHRLYIMVTSVIVLLGLQSMYKGDGYSEGKGWMMGKENKGEEVKDDDSTQGYVPLEGNDLALYKACRDGDEGLVKTLLGEGANVNGQNKEGKTPLFVATSKNNLSIVGLLLKQKDIKVDLARNNRMNPLWIAASKKYTDIVVLFVKHKKNIGINKEGPHKNRPIHIASYKGHVDVVDELSKHPEINLNPYNVYGETPLKMACANGRTDVVKLLIEGGAKLEQKEGNLLDDLDKNIRNLASEHLSEQERQQRKQAYPKIGKLLVDHGLVPTNKDILDGHPEWCTTPSQAVYTL